VFEGFEVLDDDAAKGFEEAPANLFGEVFPRPHSVE
jgi:hypothetical protein